MEIKSVTALPDDIHQLIDESEQDGFRFLRRLFEDFNTGRNTFNKAEEALFVVKIDGVTVAIGGVNIQPDSPVATGRLRRFYVRKKYRKNNIGKALLNFIERHAVTNFEHLVLFTDSAAAKAFYKQCGYLAVEHPKYSHYKQLT